MKIQRNTADAVCCVMAPLKFELTFLAKLYGLVFDLFTSKFVLKLFLGAVNLMLKAKYRRFFFLCLCFFTMFIFFGYVVSYVNG